MTKTLTEQWREGTLATGWYYTKHDDGKIYIWLCFKDDCSYIENPEVKKILAPVPSYDEYKRLVSNSDDLILCLQKMVEDECSRRCELETKCSQLEKELSRKTLQLEIATKALDNCQGFDFVQYALKEMEGVK